MPGYEKQIALPSKGLLYKGKLPEGLVEIRSMTTQEEKLLASGSGVQVLDSLFKRCAKLPDDLQANKLLVADRFSLLLHIRNLSYGPAYRVTYNCGSCHGLNYEDVDIEKDVLSAEEPLTEDSSETYEVVLPVSGKTLTMSHPTGEDEAASEKHNNKNKNRKGGISDIQEFRLARQIVAIDGGPCDNIVEVMGMLRTISVRDSLAIRDAQRAQSFGVSNLSFNFTCSKCSSEQPPMGLPVSEDFFRVVSPRD
jgi:hypothetical protein